MNKKILISLVFFAFLINIVSAGYWEESYNVDLVNYFKLDEGSGSTVIDAHENINGTQTNANQGVAGKINTAYNLSASDSAYISYPNDFQNSDNLGSFSFWWYTEKEACSNSPLWSSSRSGASELIRVFPTSSCQMQIQHYENPGGINDAVNGNVTFANDTWYYVVFQSDGSDWYLYVNGYPANLSIAVGSNTGAWLNDLSSVQSVGFGREFIGTANYGNVYLDEVAYWSRVINNTEILNIYNEGYGISYNQTVPAGSPNITLNSPPNNYVSSSSSIIFNVTVTDQIKVDNVSIYLDGVLNETNSSGINGTYLFSKSFLDGSYNWSIIAWNNNSLNNTSFTRDFIIDTIDPSIDVDSPQGQLDYLIQDYNMTLNFTATDNNLEDCVWIYNGSSTIIPCSNDTLTTYYFNYEVGENNGTLFVNDSAGRSNTYAVNWTYSVLENFVNYSEVTFETATEDYILNLTLGSGVSLTSAYLHYNGTSYSSNIYSYGTVRIVNNSLSVPLTNISYNATFFWELNTNVGDFNTSGNIQLVNTLKIDNCSVNTHLILNYTIYDEDTRNMLIDSQNITANLYVQLSGDESGALYNYYAGTVTTKSIPICVDNALLSGENYRLDALIQYEASDYVQEYNYIDNYALNTSSSPLNMSLYLLAINNSQEFLITYKDSNLLPVEGAIIELTRQYPELGPGQFLSVENMKTDNDGKTIGHFVLNDVIYTIYVRVDGELTAVYENQRAFCTNLVTGDCQISLNEKTSTGNPQSYLNYLDVIATQDYDKTSHELTFSFTTTDGSSKTINLSMYKLNGTLITDTVCSEELTSSAGSLICSIPAANYNDTVKVKVLVDSEIYTEYTFNLQTGFSNSEVDSKKYLLAFFLIITLPLLGFTSGPMTLILFIIGFIAAGGLFLLDMGGLIGPLSAFLWFVVAGAILLVKSSQRRQQV